MFNGVVNSGCGTAQAAMGPFYCPADQKVYIDTAFFKDMRTQMGITGEQNQTELSRQDQAGDFAQAYVVAHEVGHHIQTILGISEQVQQARAQALKLKVIVIRSCKNYKQTALRVFGRIIINSVPNF
jgi:Predicted metalloprotease